jgi:hypothetical protein
MEQMTVAQLRAALTAYEGPEDANVSINLMDADGNSLGAAYPEHVTMEFDTQYPGSALVTIHAVPEEV